MAKKSVVLTITVWDDQVRLSFISKTMATLVSKTFHLNVLSNNDGIRTIDPFEVIYFVRTGIQQLLSLKNVVIHSIGIATMPGYLMLWDHKTCTPVSAMHVPNNSLKDLAYQEFKFSEFYSLYRSKQQESTFVTPNALINLWVISKQFKKVSFDNHIYSGLDTWLGYLLSGYNDHALISDKQMMSEFLLDSNDWDSALLKAVQLTEAYFPKLNTSNSIQTKNFYPLVDGVPISYNLSTNQLLSTMLDSYSNDPIACVHLSNINHVYFSHLDANQHSTQAWVRFAGEKSIRSAFNIPQDTTRLGLTLSDILDDQLISIDPFQSFYNQVFHFFNVNDLSPQTLLRLSMLQSLFLIKYLISFYEKQTLKGHIKTLLVSSDEWDESTLQLCVDLCQIEGVEFKISNWMDMIHIHAFTLSDNFFSNTEQQRLFKVKSRLIPSLDPLSCYSLYQPWEAWFNKLYDFRH
ncbi:MAG: hypothetical protein VXX85_01385 [Candidatus Margulisiibacteriota bacterium]|nr:hypothetical protein [Candidatus Margulisiibacteriota bacterium]